MGISRNNASVKSDINPALSLRRLDLLVQPCHRCRGRDGIEGHVNDGGNSSSCGGLCARLESLPFCPPWLIEVYVCIDKSRK